MKSDVNADAPQERVAAPVPEEPKAPLQLPELILSEASEKKEEILEKPAEEPMKPEIKLEMPESNESKEKEEKPMR